MEFERVVKKRKSVRNFKSKTPSWKDVLYAIDLANQGPFADNQNHLRYVIIENPSSAKAYKSYFDILWRSAEK